jgi:hypothetical protein
VTTPEFETEYVFIGGNTYPVYKKLKELGGVWDKSRKEWRLPKAHEEQARALIASVPVKPEKPKAPQQLQEADDAVDLARRAYEAACRFQHRVRDSLVAMHITRGDIYGVIYGSHECEKSPTARCVYQDHDMDECIFCHDPHERK